MRRWSGSVFGVVAVTAFAVFCLLAAVSNRRDASDPPDDAVADFLAAWERSRTATYVVESQFVRRSVTGNELRSVSRVAQRPPDRLVTAFDGVTGIIDGELVRCTSQSSDGKVGCTRTPGATFDEQLADELAILSAYVRGQAAPYTTQADGEGCFVLRQTRVEPLSPYGSEARFCFDEATGAPAQIRIDHDEIVDTTVALEIRTTVTDDDLRVPG